MNVASETELMPTTTLHDNDSVSPAETAQTLRVVSVSLGSSSRDHTARVSMLGRDFLIERRGVDGDLKRARNLIAELDGKVAAIGLGGIDLYLVAGKKRYTMREAKNLARAAKITPVVDGSGLKHSLERRTIRHLAHDGTLSIYGQNVLLVSAVDRFGMAEEFKRLRAKVVFGDFMFILGLNYPITRLRDVRRLGTVILPIACQLPFKLLYPTGDKQNEIKVSSKHQKFYDEADIIAGDFLLIRRFLPARIDGKTVVTNTVTLADIELLRERGAKMLITTTPELEGRSFGTNVMEGVFAALGAQTPSEYSKLLDQLNWQPRVVKF